MSGQVVQVAVDSPQLVVGVRLADVLPRHHVRVDVAAVGILAIAEEFDEGVLLPGWHDRVQIWTGGWPEAARRAATQVGSMTRGAASRVDQVLAIGRRVRRRSDLRCADVRLLGSRKKAGANEQ